MKTLPDLSPLAFEILKFLCNSSDPDGFQTISKDTLGIEDQATFDQAVAELAGEHLIEVNDITAPEEDRDNYDRYVTDEKGNSNHHIRIIAARINNNQGDICGEIDYYIAAQRDTDV
jgi:signal recognition particle subunit SEC65